MELKYIWVDVYNSIENLGFNFNHSGDHRFNYDERVLTLLPNENFLIKFGPNITGVTAIAGENGSGKSSLCEAVLSSTATYTNGYFGFDRPFKGIVCYGDHIFIHNDLILNNIADLQVAKYKVVRFQDSPFEDMRSEWKETFVKGAFIYYSNILDYRSNIQEANLANISTLESLMGSWHYSTSYSDSSFSNQNVRNNNVNEKYSLFQIYNNVEGNRLVNLYLNHFKLVSFIKARYFVIKNTYSGNNRWINLDMIENEKKEWFDYRLLGIQSIQNEIFDLIFEKKQPDKIDEKIKTNPTLFSKAAKQLYRYNLILTKAIIDKRLPEVKDARDFVYRSFVKDENEYKSEIKRLLEIYDLIIDRSKGLEISHFNPYTLKIHYEEAQDWRFYLIENWYLENDENNRELLLEFINLEKQVLQSDLPFRKITNLNLSPLSSGENSMLTLFSRIQDVVSRYTTGTYDKNHLILFIDEGEVAFHPAWKRLYFKMLLDFLNNGIKAYKFQIILTTHSPYLLSDLPSQNVILLQKDINGKTKLVSSNDFKTFGSNIHELLATNFFLNDGFIGEFAKKKIEDLILFLEKGNQSYTKESAKQLISLIGDELIASRLTDMYNDRFKDQLSSDDEQYLTWLSTEIQRIQLKVKR